MHAMTTGEDGYATAPSERDFRAIALDILIGEATAPAMTDIALDAALEPRSGAMTRVQSSLRALVVPAGPQTLEELNESYALTLTLAEEATALRGDMLFLTSALVILAGKLATQLADVRGGDVVDVLKSL